MADIAKCHQELCPLHPTCWRYCAPAGSQQGWIAPVQRGADCDFYWPTAAAAEVLAGSANQPIPANSRP